MCPNHSVFSTSTYFFLHACNILFYQVYSNAIQIPLTNTPMNDLQNCESTFSQEVCTIFDKRKIQP